jgi:hypothetical protein
VAPYVVERLFNDAAGTISGVAAIYNHFKYEIDCRNGPDGCFVLAKSPNTSKYELGNHRLI